MKAMTKRETERKIIRCAVYTRKSTEEGLEQEFNTLDAQRDAGEAYIRSQKHEGWECLQTQYDDGGFTGANMDRPALRQLLADIEAGEIDCVVVYKVDRLSRSLLDFSRIIEIFDRHKVAFVSVTQAFNTASSMGRLILNVLLSFAQFEREMISERTRDKIAAARRKGRWVGGVPILGYTVRDTKLNIDPLEAVRVQEIFELYIDRQSALAVAKEVNDRGWRTKQWVTKKGKACGGQLFHKNSICAMLSNVAYVGKIAYAGETYPGLHEAIIDQVTFDRAQAILRHNNVNKGRKGRCKHHPLLQGLLRCAACDCSMSHSYSKKGSRLYRYYVCRNAQKLGWDSCPAPSLPAGELESFVVDQIRKIGEDTGVVRDTLAQAKLQTQQQAERLKRERAALQRVIRDGYERMNRGVKDREDAERLAAHQGNLREKELRLNAVHDELTVLVGVAINETAVEAGLADFDRLWQAFSPAERSRLVHQIVARVTYDGRASNLSITYHASGIDSIRGSDSPAAGVASC